MGDMEKLKKDSSFCFVLVVLATAPRAAIVQVSGWPQSPDC